jgi:hypothetical protein
MAAVEAPGMIARIPLIGKLSSAALPFQSYFVFGHVCYVECGQALGNRLFFKRTKHGNEARAFAEEISRANRLPLTTRYEP